MKTFRVGICSSDPDYSVRLMDFINSDTSLGINAVMFSSMNALREYLEVEDIDLILTDDTSECSLLQKGYNYYDTKVVELSDYQMVRSHSSGLEEEAYIYKYQPVSVICKLIKKELLAGTDSSRRVVECLGVYSPLGRCGKTRLAKTLAGYDEVRGGLYVGMEDFSERMNGLQSNILYLIKSKSPDIGEAINTEIITESGIGNLYLSGTYADTRDVTSEDMKMLLQELLKTGRFTSVVCDIGEAAFENLSILDVFNHIYMPVLDDQISKNKLEIFMKYMRDTGNAHILRKIKTVHVPDVEAGSNEMIKAVWRLKNGDDEWS
ncbi:MAG: hypothetical protein IKS48_07165 [Eubacterium sp.]|nr:hypothetical protein [Eubacterium sp.]